MYFQVRRETHALTKAQQQEIERINVEATEARILHEVRIGHRVEGWQTEQNTNPGLHFYFS